MKKLIKFFSLLFAFLMILQIPASAESLQDNLVPPDTREGSVGEVDLKYNEFPQHHYNLDTYVDTDGDWMPWNWAEGAGKQIYIALMEIVNSIWNVNILLANFTMLIVQEAFELDFVSNVSEEIGTAIQHIAGFNTNGFMGTGLWPLLVTFVIGIVGAWATYVGMIKREDSRAWGGLISSIIIFVFALGFFSNASTILKGVNDWSSKLQSDILAVSASIVNPGSSYSKEEGIASIRNQMFDLMVKKPYLLMQYGTTQVKEKRVNSLLSIDPYSSDRQDKAKEEVEQQENTMMSINGVSQRAGFVTLLFIANSIIGVFLLIVSGTIILYQMLFLALVLFAPVPLLMALVPKWKQSAIDWAMKVVHAQLMKIAIALLLTILFGISAILYRATESSNLGYLGMMLLQIICFVGVWAKRKDLFAIVSTAVNNVQTNTGATLQGYRQKYNQARNMVQKGQNLIDKGRIRHQPLVMRNRDHKKANLHGQMQLADRLKQNQENNQGSRGITEEAVGTNQHHHKLHERGIKKRSGIENASLRREQLMNRKRKSRKENMANSPVLNREVAASIEPVESHNTKTSNQTTRDQGENLAIKNSRKSGRPAVQDATNVERIVTDKKEGAIGETMHRNNVDPNHERGSQPSKRHPTATDNQVMNRHNEKKVQSSEKMKEIKIDPSKPITQWEAQQQINRRNHSKE